MIDGKDSAEAECEFPAGEFLLLESGEYSGRWNTGLYRIRIGFNTADLPSKELPPHMIGRGEDWKELTDEFKSRHLGLVDMHELNIDFITVRAEEGHPGYVPPPTEDEKAQKERREFKLSRAGRW